eukprot:CAMPEP_0170322348 /NCGR_PEP_ID=MMETSP0116_2-20130129/61955_1 /TAXON_ID=400756 /ORGANISM="Durinskia baltica, Strain CSIRO CS-38" /LENGTH=149 /DNA_ID=CAMNT_0010575213 /DNA_START=725 /DNA_END=1175 /DNA_ORIENTATION=-
MSTGIHAVKLPDEPDVEPRFLSGVGVKLLELLHAAGNPPVRHALDGDAPIAQTHLVDVAEVSSRILQPFHYGEGTLAPWPNTQCGPCHRAQKIRLVQLPEAARLVDQGLVAEHLAGPKVAAGRVGPRHVNFETFSHMARCLAKLQPSRE